MLETSLLNEWFWSTADLMCLSGFMFLMVVKRVMLLGLMCKKYVQKILQISTIKC